MAEPPSSKEEAQSPRLYVALLAELLGTLFLVLVACGSCSPFSAPDTGVVRISLAFAFSIATIVWNTARVSGGHLNPAVTVGFLVTRRISVVRALLYVGVQMLGAVLGAAILLALSNDYGEFHDSLGTSSPPKTGGVSGVQVLIIELLITFVLVWTVFATVDPRRTDLAGSGPLAIGLSIGMCHLWAVSICYCHFLSSGGGEGGGYP